MHLTLGNFSTTKYFISRDANNSTVIVVAAEKLLKETINCVIEREYLFHRETLPIFLIFIFFIVTAECDFIRKGNGEMNVGHQHGLTLISFPFKLP